MNIKVKKILVKFLNIASFFNRFIPKDENRILLYTNLGFRDNVKAFYDYLVTNGFNRKYRIICSTDVYEQYSDCNIDNIRFVSPLEGGLAFFRSKYVFYCFGKIPVVPSKKQKVVNFWHGFPLKTIGNLENPDALPYKYFSMILSQSEELKDIMTESMNCDTPLVAGPPRCDALFESHDVPLFHGYSKVIVWMPTFRKSDRLHVVDSESSDCLPLFDSEKDMEAVSRTLKLHNVLLYVKLHPMDSSDYGSYEKYDNIVIHRHSDFDKMNVDLYGMLSVSDALITDYSSVYIDYLLLDKPIAFILNDMEEYGNNRGFVFDNPVDYMPGNILSTKDDFIDFISKVCDGVDEFVSERRHMNDVFNKNQNGHFCEDIVRQLGL